MAVHTRFRPTPYSDLHLGHAWCAYNNWKLARQSGGKFLLIIDDVAHKHGGLEWGSRDDPTAIPLKLAQTHYLEDLDWLGLAADECVLSSANLEAHHEAARRVDIRPPLCWEPVKIMLEPIVMGDGKSPLVEYHPYSVLVGVVDDHVWEIGAFVRGMDLYQEACLYDYLCKRLGWRVPAQEYVPLVKPNASWAKLAKSMRPPPPSIRDMRERGYMPQEVMDTLLALEEDRKAYLRDTIVVGDELSLGDLTTKRPQRKFVRLPKGGRL